MIGVIGVGSFGTALAKVLANNTQDPVYVWDNNEELLSIIAKEQINTIYLPDFKLPSNIKPVKTLSELLEKVDDILIAVPSKFFTNVLNDIKPILKNHRIIYATKGLVSGNKGGHLLHEVIINTFGKEQIYAVLSGPSFAAEIMKNIPTAVTIASNNSDFTNDLIKYFHCDTFKIYQSQDIIGVQLGGIIKNIIALACGIADGLGCGSNTQAAIITKGLNELLLLGSAIGAKTETLLGLAGCGDIILTATDNQSRNRRMGLLIGQGKLITDASKQIGQAVESLNNCSIICNLAKENNVNLQLANEIEKILSSNKASLDIINNLI